MVFLTCSGQVLLSLCLRVLLFTSFYSALCYFTTANRIIPSTHPSSFCMLISQRDTL